MAAHSPQTSKEFLKDITASTCLKIASKKATSGDRTSSPGKGFRSTPHPINPWQISFGKLGGAVALPSEQLELHPLHIYILIESNNGLYSRYGINTT